MNVLQMKPVSVLPKKLSAQLRLAVHDARLVSKDKRYILDMQAWHMPQAADLWTDKKLCHVCMAGSLLAVTMGVPPSQALPFRGIKSRRLADILLGINALRSGEDADQLRKRAKTPNQQAALYKALYHIKWHYKTDWLRAAWPVYLKAANILEAGGL